jgi:hypothetical protein
MEGKRVVVTGGSGAAAAMLRRKEGRNCIEAKRLLW